MKWIFVHVLLPCLMVLGTVIVISNMTTDNNQRVREFKKCTRWLMEPKMDWLGNIRCKLPVPIKVDFGQDSNSPRMMEART